MSDLKQQAEALGIKIDGRWSDERIQHEIDKVHAEAKRAEKAEPFGGEGDHDGDGKPGGSVRPGVIDGTLPAKAVLLPFRINRDFWDDTGARHRKKSIVEMTAEEALDGIETGALSRVK